MSSNAVIRFGLPVVTSTLLFASQSIIKNETKRSFYEDEETVTPIPGTTVAASATEIEALGPSKLINGASIRSPSALESSFGSARNWLNNVIFDTSTKINELNDDFHANEETFTTALSNLHNKKEELLPASVYILVGALTGTIITRRSNIFLKTTVPLVLGLVAFKFTLPKTFQNTTSLAHDLQHKNLPELTAKQDELVKDINHLVLESESKTLEAEKFIQKQVENSKKVIASVTGLNIDAEVSKKK